MTVNIHFDTGFLSSEEADGLTAFLGAVRPALLTADALRRRVDAQYAPYGQQIAGSTTVSEVDGFASRHNDEKGESEPVAAPAPVKATRSRKPKVEEIAAAADAKPAISTDPENRIDPQNSEDEAQDAADEAEETAAAQEPDKPVTVEDVKAAIGQYVAKFQLPATQEDGPGIFKSVLGAPPAGEPYWKLSILPADQAKLAACRDAWLAAAGKAERTKVS